MVQKNSLKKIVIICGPTASGKSDLAIEVAKILDSEVISADSMYIYKGLNVGTAKPTFAEMQGIKHHLIDVVEPNQTFTVSDYKTLAEPIIDQLHARGKIPVVCGGTGFYINSLLFDLSYGNSSSNFEAREKYKKLAEEKGNEYVYDCLKAVDPESALKLHFNDVKRVIRALEIYESGTLKSEIKDDFKPKYDYFAYSLNHDRETLYKRINLRVDKMIDDGLLDEIKSLLSQGITANDQCMQAIGYKEFFDYISGDISLQEAIARVKLNTRHYAKRQITFFKKLSGLTYLQPCDNLTLAKTITEGLL